jgi:hypothetical protein
MRICGTCSCTQIGTPFGKCNQLRCNGRLEDAWRCGGCDLVQVKGTGSCRKCSSVLALVEEVVGRRPIPVGVQSHRVMPTAANLPRTLPAIPQQAQAQVAIRKADVAPGSIVQPQRVPLVADQTPSRTALKSNLEAALKKGPSQIVRESATVAPTPIIDAPKVVRSVIPAPTATQRKLVQDCAFVESLLRTKELRSIIVPNTLRDYDPTEGGLQAAGWATEEELKAMNITMAVLLPDAQAWDLMGKKALLAGAAACQQCVAIMFHKIVQNPAFSSCIQLVHVKGHHFLMFGEPKNGKWQVDKLYVVDLWVQNLRRPKVKTKAELGNDSPDWKPGLVKYGDPGQTFYADRAQGGDWAVDLDYDPLEKKT